MPFIDFANTLLNVDRILTVTEAVVDGAPQVTFTMDAGAPIILPGTRVTAMHALTVAGRRNR